MLQFAKAIVSHRASCDRAFIVATYMPISRLIAAFVALIIPLDTGLTLLFLLNWFYRFFAAIHADETSSIVNFLGVHQKSVGVFVERCLLSGGSLHDSVSHAR